MNFTSIVFLFIFLPITLVLYYSIKKWSNKTADIILTIFSFVFYAWAVFDNIIKLFVYIALLYWMGLTVHYIYHKVEKDNKYKSERNRIITGFIMILIGILFYYKYQAEVIYTINRLSAFKLKSTSVIAPLGISYIIFSSISYLIDIKRGDETPGGFFKTALFISFFPKVACGPIIKYKDFYKQQSQRHFDLELFYNGINRLIIGMVKKLMFADYFGQLISNISEQPMDTITAIGTCLLYALQLLFDFDGYSDMAIGIAMMFGFKLPDNFNHPYMSLSITEFWRRWHMTLGAFFKEYLYIPLGGNRKGKIRTLLNLGIVFLVTGIWHGAGSTYLIWGSIHGIFIIIERILKDKKAYIKTPRIIKWFITMTIVVLGWQLFRFNDINTTITFLKSILHPSNEYITFTWRYYFDTKCIFFAITGFLWSSFMGCNIFNKLNIKLKNVLIIQYTKQIILFGLFIAAIICMINSSYSPFIYFRY